MNQSSEIARAGGAYVRRRFTFGGEELRAGATLSADQLRSIPIANRRALISTGKIEIWPQAPADGSSLPAGSETFLVHLGGGKYHVVKGVRLTEQTVSREEAEEIATRPENATN